MWDGECHSIDLQYILDLANIVKNDSLSGEFGSEFRETFSLGNRGSA